MLSFCTCMTRGSPLPVHRLSTSHKLNRMYTHARITICKTNRVSIPMSSADRPELTTHQEDRTTGSRAPPTAVRPTRPGLTRPGSAEADGPCRLQQSNPRRRNRTPRRASANLPASGTHTLAKLSNDCVSLITARQPLIRPLHGCVWAKAAGVIVAPFDGILPRPRSTSGRTTPIADDNSCPCEISWREHRTGIVTSSDVFMTRHRVDDLLPTAGTPGKRLIIPEMPRAVLVFRF